MWELLEMTPKEYQELKKFVDEFIMTSEDPLREMFKVMKAFYHQKITKLKKEIEALKIENAELKRDKINSQSN